MAIGCSACSDIAVHWKKSVERGLASKWCTILEVASVCNFTNADEKWNLRLKWTRHRSREKIEGDAEPLEKQDVEMLVEAPAASASVKRGSDAVADNEERARLRLRAEGKRGQKHDMQDVLELQARTKVRPEPRRGQKRESTQPLPDLEEEVTLTVPVASGSAPIQGGSSLSADVPINSSVAASVSVDNTVQTDVLISASVGIQAMVQFDLSASLKARSETLRN